MSARKRKDEARTKFRQGEGQKANLTPTPLPPQRGEVKDDPRVIEMCSCIWFALKSFRNHSLFDARTREMTTWHDWFRRTLRDAGYELPEDKRGPGDERGGANPRDCAAGR